MNHIRKATLTATLFLALSACAGSTSAPVRMAGAMLVGDNGMTLYTFDKDTAGSGKSVCVAKCAENWPPLYAAAGAKAEGDYTLVTRDDGRQQWAYKGKPLYFWVKDQKPGDTSGEGVNGVWHVAR